MSARMASLRTDVLSLPADDRAALAADLLASLDDDVAGADRSEIGHAWGDEIVRRSEEVASGQVTPLSWSEVLEHLAASRNSR